MTGASIASLIIAILGVIAAYLKTRKTDATLENKDLKEAKETIDKMSNRPVTNSDVRRMFARAKVTARERDKAE